MKRVWVGVGEGLEEGDGGGPETGQLCVREKRKKKGRQGGGGGAVYMLGMLVNPMV